MNYTICIVLHIMPASGLQQVVYIVKDWKIQPKTCLWAWFQFYVTNTSRTLPRLSSHRKISRCDQDQQEQAMTLPWLLQVRGKLVHLEYLRPSSHAKEGKKNQIKESALGRPKYH